MRNLVYGELRPAIERATGLCSTNAASAAQLVAMANEAQERLMNRAEEWVGTMVRYQFCASEACLVLPRQVRTVQGMKVCGNPGVVRPEFYSYLGNGPGDIPHDMSIDTMLEDQGIAVAFDEVRRPDSYIRVYAQNACDAGKRVMLKYYRGDTLMKFYGPCDGYVEEGETLTLVPPPGYAVTSTTVMKGGLYSVVKDKTEYPINLFEYDGSINTNTLAQYEPSETVPTYRRVRIPGLANMGSCGGSACESAVVQLYVRLQHVPFELDNDLLVLGNVAALKFMTMAVKRELSNDLEGAAVFEAKAVKELQGELAAYRGSGEQVVINFAKRGVWGVGDISLANWPGTSYNY